MPTNENIELLIARYISGDCSAEEQEQLEAWASLSAENREKIATEKKLWDLLLQSSNVISVDLQKEWKYLSSKTIKINEHTFFITSKMAKTIMRYAAIIIVFISIGIISYRISFNNTNKEIASTIHPESINLPDGSVVTLNSHSSLKYKTALDKHTTRNVCLTGSAYFKVTKRPSQPFKIEINGHIVEVLGTSFYIETENGQTSVIVETGKVAVYNDNDSNKVYLLPGEKALCVNKSTIINKSTNYDENYLAWKTHCLKFQDKKLPKVIEEINKAYKSNIVLKSNEYNECRITVIFENQSLESVLNVLQSTLDLEIKQTPVSIEIDGDGC